MTYGHHLFRQLLPYLLFLSAAVWLIAENGFASVLLPLVGFGIPIVLGVLRMDKLMRMKRYGNQKENIYVTSRYPGDRTLVRRKEEHEDWLVRADNRLKVKVRIILYQDHLHPNETWEEYEIRQDEEIKADRKERHNWLHLTKGADWYFLHMANQEGVVLEDS